MKLFGAGFYMYLLDTWNKFDIIILILNDVILIVTSQGNIDMNIEVIPVFLRSLRLGRIVKYVLII